MTILQGIIFYLIIRMENLGNLSSLYFLKYLDVYRASHLLIIQRLLKWRLKNYQPHKHLGGYIYLFLKGLPDIELFEKSKSEDISPGIFISNAPLKRINYLDKLF